MNDALLNCLLEICCNPLRSEEALVHFFEKYCQLPNVEARKAAKGVREYFDLGPKGLVTPLLQYAAKLARGADYKAEGGAGDAGK